MPYIRPFLPESVMLRATGCASMAENSKYAAVNYKYQVPCLTYPPSFRDYIQFYP